MGVEDARGEKVENKLAIADAHGVPRVRASLVACHDIGIAGKHVDDLSFSFVAPLGADNNLNRHDGLSG
jgi:hypothetical protein